MQGQLVTELRVTTLIRDFLDVPNNPAVGFKSSGRELQGHVMVSLERDVKPPTKANDAARIKLPFGKTIEKAVLHEADPGRRADRDQDETDVEEREKELDSAVDDSSSSESDATDMQHSSTWPGWPTDCPRSTRAAGRTH